MSSEEPPTKKARRIDTIDILMQEMRDELKGLREELDKKNETLIQVVELFARGYVGHGGLEEILPDFIKNDEEMALHYLLKKDRVYNFEREKFSNETLQKIIPVLVKDHRPKALELLETNFLSYDDVQPNVDESKDSLFLSLLLLQRGKVKDLALLPKLTPAFLTLAVKNTPNVWEHVPEAMKQDIAFCRSLFMPIPDDSLGDSLNDALRLSILFAVRVPFNLFHQPEPWYLEVFRLHSQLARDRQIWEVMQNDNAFSILKLFESGYFPDDGILEQICRKDEHAMSIIDQVAHANLVETLVRESPKKVFRLTTDFIEAYPDFLVEHLAKVRFDESHSCEFSLPGWLLHQIPPPMWHNEALANTWFQVGLPLWHSEQPDEWKSDRAKLLFVAKHGATLQWKSSAVRYAADELQNDLEFMKQVVDIAPFLFAWASGALRYSNYDLAVRACADQNILAVLRESRISFQRDEQARPFPVEFEARRDSELAQHQAFMNPFLCGIQYQQTSGLRLLMEEGILHQIAVFAGIPRGRHLRNLRKWKQNADAFHEDYFM